jgi:hypothetical protein
MDRDPTGCSHPSEAWSHQQRFQEVLDLRAKVASLAKDAERYEWLQRHKDEWWGQNPVSWETKTGMNKYIDAAIAQAKQAEDDT